MAINKQPIARKCRSFDVSPAVMGYGNKKSNRNPGGTRRKKVSEYGAQLKEKQKVKFVYGILEKQFHMYYEKASRMPGKTGENLLTLVERRLDNVVYRLGFAQTRRQARQLATHGHFTVNGQRVDIPSFQVKVGDVNKPLNIANLYVDDKTKLPESQWITNDSGKQLKDVGRVNSYIALSQFGVNSQPNYFILNEDGDVLKGPRSYDLDVEGYLSFLSE